MVIVLVHGTSHFTYLHSLNFGHLRPLFCYRCVKFETISTQKMDFSRIAWFSPKSNALKINFKLSFFNQSASTVTIAVLYWLVLNSYSEWETRNLHQIEQHDCFHKTINSKKKKSMCLSYTCINLLYIWYNTINDIT